ncbi:hypothetical protein [Umezawaea sp. Da 62-37]|uniref:hypothetical protein n=1 Tax=Umezawaea sp. Da 62-37 TaxID=3075927 RepID=UPI0028F7288C|nr:hypothetical protein [Umezawaea sp. Da 62-37]WNV83133.1 hypothetical protein RM788_33770 [Umezawaea sp. Da 62-37]
MWNDILGALAMLAMILLGIVLLTVLPQVADAISDRIRYGAQNPLTDEEQEQDEASPTAEPDKAAKPVTALPGKSVPATTTARAKATA